MKHPDPSNDLCIDDALSRFESCLESTVVPGEFPSWASALTRACEELGEPLRREIEESHGRQLAQIRREDADLLRRVEQLRDADSQLLEGYGTLREQVEQFLERAERDEPHESKLALPLTKHGL